jgi:hypothetical protein
VYGHDSRKNKMQFDSAPRRMDIVYKYWKSRVSQCKRCPYHQHWLGKLITCGTVAVGDVVIHGGKEVHLCGCIMQLKAKIESSKCPIDNWSDADNKDK